MEGGSIPKKSSFIKSFNCCNCYYLQYLGLPLRSLLSIPPESLQTQTSSPSSSGSFDSYRISLTPQYSETMSAISLMSESWLAFNLIPNLDRRVFSSINTFHIWGPPSGITASQQPGHPNC